MSWGAVADQVFGKWGGFLKVDLFGSDVDFCCPVARMSGGCGRGAPLAPPTGSGVEPKHWQGGLWERFELPSGGLGRSSSRQRILVNFRANVMQFRAI